MEKQLDKSKTYSFYPAGNDKTKIGGPLDTRSLKSAGTFTIVFMDSKTIKVKLLEIDNYNLVVESNGTGNKLLIPKHAIKYILLT